MGRVKRALCRLAWPLTDLLTRPTCRDTPYVKEEKNVYHQVWNSHYFQRIMTQKQGAVRSAAFMCSTAYNVPAPALPAESGPHKTYVWLRRSWLQYISIRGDLLKASLKFQGKPKFQKARWVSCQCLSELLERQFFKEDRGCSLSRASPQSRLFGMCLKDRACRFPLTWEAWERGK